MEKSIETENFYILRSNAIDNGDMETAENIYNAIKKYKLDNNISDKKKSDVDRMPAHMVYIEYTSFDIIVDYIIKEWGSEKKEITSMEIAEIETMMQSINLKGLSFKKPHNIRDISDIKFVYNKYTTSRPTYDSALYFIKQIKNRIESESFLNSILCEDIQNSIISYLESYKDLFIGNKSDSDSDSYSDFDFDYE
jgi:hypothetical protein